MTEGETAIKNMRKYIFEIFVWMQEEFKRIDSRGGISLIDTKAITSMGWDRVSATLEDTAEELRRRFNEMKKRQGGVCCYGELVEELLEALK